MTEYLVKLARNTRGKASRLVEFLGIQTEIQSVDSEGKPEFTNAREGNEPQPVMIPVALDRLPAVDVVLQGIYALLYNSDESIRRHLAKLYNAIAFQIEVDKTAAIPAEDNLTPIFAEYGIADEALITTLRRNVSTAFGIAVKTGKVSYNLNSAEVAEKKAKILRRQLDMMADI
jgi:hypothetical protein